MILRVALKVYALDWISSDGIDTHCPSLISESRTEKGDPTFLFPLRFDVIESEYDREEEAWLLI